MKPAHVAPRPKPPPVAASAPASSASAAPPTASSAAPEPVEPPLVDADGKPLPQTEDKPSTTDERFQRRIKLLVQAIRDDDPSIALPAFFPVIAYRQVKDVAKPDRDWKLRLVAAFERNVHEYHRELGAAAKTAELSAVEVPEDKARWMKPGSEGNRIGYYRVLRSRLRLALADGKTKEFEITSLISWRGEWYVVHLNGFK